MGITIPYSKEEIALIKKTYKENANSKNGWLNELSIKLNRPKTNISRFARQNNLSDRNRAKPMTSHICPVCDVSFSKQVGVTKFTCSKKCGDVIGSSKRTGGHIWLNRKHPQGMLGKKQSSIMKEKTSARVKKVWADPSSSFNSEENKQKASDRMSKMQVERVMSGSNVYSRTKKGWREFPSGKRYFFRSGWEMNYALYLEWLMYKKEIKNWEYERETFWFEKIRRGVRSYTPDFFVTNNNGSEEIHEVKGWLDSKSKTKLARMAKYYPDVKVILIGESEYKELKKWGKMIGFE